MLKFAVIPALAAALLLSACSDGADTSAEPAPAAATDPAPAVAMPADAPPQEEAAASEADSREAAANDTEGGPCIADFGQDVAERLVERCLAVSPATRPPCNVQNPCAMIQGEIDRSCAQYGPGETKPAECSA